MTEREEPPSKVSKNALFLGTVRGRRRGALATRLPACSETVAGKKKIGARAREVAAKLATRNDNAEAEGSAIHTVTVDGDDQLVAEL